MSEAHDKCVACTCVAGLAPFAAVYLLVEKQWSPKLIGVALTLNSVTQFAVQTPSQSRALAL